MKDRNWERFCVGDLFKVKRPTTRSNKDYQTGDTPFVASGNFNNGVMTCCKVNNEQLDAGNCITVSPVDGSSFYQRIDFLGRGGAGSSVLLLYNQNLNHFNGLFLARTIRQTCSKYCYGKMGSQQSVKREQILIPVDAVSNPDYDFMTKVSRNIIIQKLLTVMNELQNKLYE